VVKSTGDNFPDGGGKREEMQSKAIGLRVAMCPGKRRALPDTPEGRMDDLVETAKAHIRAKGEHPFRVMKPKFGFQKIRLRGMLKNSRKVNVLAALANLFMVHHLLQDVNMGGVCKPGAILLRIGRDFCRKVPRSGRIILNLP
jgi:IS5 family transposase